MTEKPSDDKVNELVKHGISSGTYYAASECDKVSDIIKQRSGTHGDAFDNLNDIGRRWAIFLNSKLDKMDAHPESDSWLTAADVAYMMVEMKLSRANYGDNAEVDHFRDMLGYSAIGAAFITKEAGLKAAKIAKSDIIQTTPLKPKGK